MNTISFPTKPRLIDLTGFLNQNWVQAALGVPVNHSDSSEAVGHAFRSTGDWFRGGFSEAIGYLLDSGVKVAGMYGDRDMACNWLGGEVAFINVPYSRQDDFNAAGYAPILSGGEEKGLVRQFGNFSFSRVYQAGHEGVFPIETLDLFAFRQLSYNSVARLPFPSCTKLVFTTLTAKLTVRSYIT